MSKWEMVKLGEVCTTTQGVQIPFNEQIDYLKSGYIRYLYIGDFKGTNKLLYVQDIYPNKIVTCEDLVMANTGSPGAVFRGIPGVLSNNLFKISFNNSIFDRDFLYLYLSSKVFQTRLQERMKGGIQKHLGHRIISEQNVPLPPLETQKQIAKTLDTAAELLVLRKQQLAELDNLIKATFYDMFGDPVTNEKGWEYCSVGDTIKTLEAGWSVDGIQRKKEKDEKAVLKVSAVTSGYFRADECKVLDNNVKIKKYVFPHKGDLLFSRANTRELVGATCVINNDYPDLLLPDKLWRLAFYSITNLIYMKYILSDNSIRGSLSNSSTGTSGSMYNVSMDKLRSINIPLPPVEFQNQFACIVIKIEEQKTLVKKAIAETQYLFDSLINKFFE